MRKHAKIWILGTILTMLMCVSTASAEEKQILQLDGSTTVGPIGDAFAEYFMKSGNVSVTVKKTGSGDGVAALIDGRCDIAMSSRFLKPEEFKKAVEKDVFPVAHAIAMDGVCIIVHPSNPIKELTTQQVCDIYMGKIRANVNRKLSRVQCFPQDQATGGAKGRVWKKQGLNRLRSGYHGERVGWTGSRGNEMVKIVAFGSLVTEISP